MLFTPSIMDCIIWRKGGFMHSLLTLFCDSYVWNVWWAAFISLLSCFTCSRSSGVRNSPSWFLSTFCLLCCEFNTRVFRIVFTLQSLLICRCSAYTSTYLTKIFLCRFCWKFCRFSRFPAILRRLFWYKDMKVYKDGVYFCMFLFMRMFSWTL